ncbi:MAG: site-2 protease family protein [Candidatus Zixiibacteriota bacterium]
MRRNIKLFSILGIEIYIHYSWFIILALVTYSLAFSYFPQQLPGQTQPTYWLMGGISALLLFVSVLLHELAHSVVAKKGKLKVDKIVLFLFGGVSQIAEEPKSAKEEFKMAFAGPLVSFILAGIFGVIWLFIMFPLKSQVLSSIFGYLALINFVLGVFNLLPGFPLDGGRILRAYWWYKTRDLHRATLLATNVGKGLSILMILLGAFQIFTGYLIGGVWMVFIGFFLRQAAEAGYQRVVIQDLLSGVKVKELMSQNPICVSPEMSVSQVVEEYFMRYRLTSFPVCQSDRVLGIITLQSVKEIPRENWSDKTIRDSVTPVSQEYILHPEDEAVEALRKIITSDLGRLPVVANGRIIGILSRKDVMNLLVIKMDLASPK